MCIEPKVVQGVLTRSKIPLRFLAAISSVDPSDISSELAPEVLLRIPPGFLPIVAYEIPPGIHSSIPHRNPFGHFFNTSFEHSSWSSSGHCPKCSIGHSYEMPSGILPKKFSKELLKKKTVEFMDKFSEKNS